MEIRNRYEGIEEYAVWFVKRKAKQLVGAAGFAEADRDDLEQEMMLDLLQRMPKYNPDLARRNTLIAHIVNHKAATIIEAEKAGKRDYRLCACSLNDFIDNGEGKRIEYMDTVDRSKYLQRIGKNSRPLIELDDLSIEIRRIMESLPPNYRELCEQLQQETVTYISENTGVSRSTIYRSIKKIQEVFENKGLRKYL